MDSISARSDDTNSNDTNLNDAKSTVEQFVAPMRQAQSVVGQVSELARTLADDSLFGNLMTQLTALPSAASFNPLQASQKLPVDISPAQQEAPQEDAQRRQFVDALQHKARVTSVEGGVGNVPGASAGSRLAMRPRASRVEQESMVTPAVMPKQNASVQGITRKLGGEQQVSVPDSVERDTVRAAVESRMALERIDTLVKQLESKPATIPSQYQEAPEPAGAPLPLSSARAPKPVLGVAPQQEQIAQVPDIIGGVKATSEKGEAVAGGLSTLQNLVEGAWPLATQESSAGKENVPQAMSPRSGGATTSTADQALSRSASAPRGASMLSPQLAGGRNTPDRGAGLSVQASTSTVPTGANAADRSGVLPQSVDVTQDDNLADRLNRALIEQAWRGGVDLT